MAGLAGWLASFNLFQKKIGNLEVIDNRDYAIDKNGPVNDKPYGGGTGMSFRPDAVAAALDAILKQNETTIYL